MPVVEKLPVEPTEHAEQGRSRRCSFATSFPASKLSASTEDPDQLAGCGMTSPAMAEKTAQQPAVEGPIEETPPEPQQPSSPTIVPEQLVEKIAQPSTSVPSTNPAEDLMKTAKYRKRCFDQIEGITETNKELTAEVERLRRQLEATDQEKTEREAQNQNLVGQLNNKEQEITSFEAEVTRLQGENSRVTTECGRLKEDNEKLARDQSELWDRTTKMKEDLKEASRGRDQRA
ncbi:uncharacterized protein [Miscanthus floridulus]|uniref:uncharacterized protein n=1 Tax=Miscanthus floridulus TaxID=154761 RepID=UPI0034583EA5